MRPFELVGVPYTSMADPGGIANAISCCATSASGERLATLGVAAGGRPWEGFEGVSMSRTMGSRQERNGLCQCFCQPAKQRRPEARAIQKLVAQYESP